MEIFSLFYTYKQSCGFLWRLTNVPPPWFKYFFYIKHNKWPWLQLWEVCLYFFFIVFSGKNTYQATREYFCCNKWHHIHLSRYIHGKIFPSMPWFNQHSSGLICLGFCNLSLKIYHWFSQLLVVVADVFVLYFSLLVTDLWIHRGDTRHNSCIFLLYGFWF